MISFGNNINSLFQDFAWGGGGGGGANIKYQNLKGVRGNYKSARGV